mmetsp:Transcript_45001/g.97754  ORF Transcript_45001/g.97754 Transcript_45001/m.97754 type:complete len:146 (+) Transcript_45001:43-480(+)|eukprot:CAMPEP_0204254032 /NCGR_PEP_ID=MMETSP0468-20130131/2310_1 /ASSEMBLY_ACC=CAM_ASM_000383 /TAXON_ID=2969 /ORGANISM="Oxyrrhis marina" /LENGTH=145 /DNA_ID=CAMNT_0051227727 /DNA_START=42 /DNA_END=479 /DNA_ORIENTATION=-
MYRVLRPASLFVVRRTFIAHHAYQAPQVWSAAVRRFCSSPDVERRVISAVEEFIHGRKAELQADLSSSELSSDDKKKSQKILDKLNELPAVTGDLSWEKAGFDEIDCVEVLLKVEDEFKHEMPDEVADNLKSVSETVAYISGLGK